MKKTLALASISLLLSPALSAAPAADWSDSVQRIPRFQHAVLRDQPKTISLGDGIELSPGMTRVLERALGSASSFHKVGGPQPDTAGLMQFQQGMRALVKHVAPTVVTIQIKNAEKKVDAKGEAPKNPDIGGIEDLIKKFLEKQPAPGQPKGQQGRPGPSPKGPSMGGLGSGVIVDNSDGKPLIVTNAHVVISAGIGGAAEVYTKDDKPESDGRKAVVLGYNVKYDLALVKLQEECRSCQVAELGDNDDIEDGDPVLAVGSPFGMVQTKTLGIVSYLGRTVAPASLVDDFIQTDAVVNPGNSGGPLFNIQGRVVGINTQIFSVTGAYMGYSFAIPVRHVVALLARYKNTGAIAASRMGIAIKPANDGVEIAEITKDTPAEKAGLLAGDVIVKIDGAPAPKTIQGLVAVIANKAPGKEVKLTVKRGNQMRDIKLKLEPILEMSRDE